MKLLYAASRRNGAHFQLNRFLRTATNHQIKIAAYEGQDYECDIDWILDALYGIFDGTPNFAGVAMDIYRSQIKAFSPDLVISDCEHITTRLANDLNIRVWQVSPTLLYNYYDGTSDKQLALKAKYPSLFSKYKEQMNEFEKSERFLVYSHLCDANLPKKCEWVRPYAKMGITSSLYKHNVVAASTTNNKPLIHRLKQSNDAMLFTECMNERHPIFIKQITSLDYSHSIKNAKQVIIQGCEDLLADAYYNGKFAWMLPDFTDPETMMSTIFNEYLVLGKIVYNVNTEDIMQMPDIEIERNNAVRSLDEEIL